MPRDRERAWHEVAEHVGGLGATIREHYQRQVQERGRSPEETRQAVADAMETLGRQVGSAFDAMGEAFHDPTVREKAVLASRAFADAVEASMADLGEEARQVRERMGRRRDR